jgi:hypothetical protein
MEAELKEIEAQSEQLQLEGQVRNADDLRAADLIAAAAGLCARFWIAPALSVSS